MAVLRPTKKKAISILVISLILIFASYIIYNYTSIGFTECGSACSGWLSPIFPSGGCIAVCVPQDIPHPSYSYILIIGVILLIISIVYFILSRKK